MRRLALLAAVLGLIGGCTNAGGGRPTESIFVGIDVSGSFHRTVDFEDSLEFLSQYLYARLNDKGDLQRVKNLFVGSIGGQITEENKSFYPIEDFQNKTPDQILADLKERFPESDKMTDFGVFFRQVADIARKRNLSLSPITVVLLTDGIPDTVGLVNTPAVEAHYENIDLSSLEYLSRKVTLRVLYPSAIVAARWETMVPRTRVRLWTVDQKVMNGWKAQFDAAKTPEQQGRLWKWIADNVDFRVRSMSVRARPEAATARSN